MLSLLRLFADSICIAVSFDLIAMVYQLLYAVFEDVAWPLLLFQFHAGVFCVIDFEVLQRRQFWKSSRHFSFFFFFVQSNTYSCRTISWTSISIFSGSYFSYKAAAHCNRYSNGKSSGSWKFRVDFLGKFN